MSQPTLPLLELAAAHEANPNTAITVNNPGIHELPPEWFELIHPSGYVYYFHPQARLLTRLDPRLSGVAERLLPIANLLFQTLPPEAAAVHIQITILSIQDDVVYYYMVDHGAHRILWAHEPAWAHLGINHPYDQGYLESRLLPYYWAHVEQYPEGTPDDVAAEERLKCTLLLGQIPGSHKSVPFQPERCQEFIIALDTVLAINGGGYRNTCVGRLWKIISTHHHQIRYGMLGPRARARLRGAIDVVGRRQLVEFGVLDRLGQFAPQFILDLTLSEVCLCLYSALLAGVSEYSSGGELLRGRLVYMGLAASLVGLPLRILYPEIQDFIATIGFEAGRTNQLKGLLIFGLLSFNLGAYLALLNLLCSALASPESLPSIAALLSLLPTLTLPLVFGVLCFIDQRVPGD